MIRKTATQLGYWFGFFGLFSIATGLARIFGIVSGGDDGLKVILAFVIGLLESAIGLLLLLRDPAVRSEKFWTWSFAPRTMQAGPLLVAASISFLIALITDYVANIARTGAPILDEYTIWTGVVAILVLVGGTALMIRETQKEAQMQDNTTAI